MKKALTLVILFVCGAGFALGLLQLFTLRFETSDAYPEYSSLRADPSGTMAIYETLQKVPGVKVSRDFSDADKLPADPNTTYLHINAPAYELSALTLDEVREVEDFVRGGGRIVITLHSQKGRAASRRMTRDEDGTDETSPSRGQMRRPSRSSRMTGTERVSPTVSLEERWGVKLDTSANEEIGTIMRASLATGDTNRALPETLEWRSNTVFTNVAKAWVTVFESDSRPVVIERAMGNGSVLLATDSWFLSNEAVLKHRNPALLAWVVGSHRNIVFDEAHLGMVEQTGVATLMRRYHLAGLLAVSLLLAGLFIWKNSFSLVPPLVETQTMSAIAGKESAAGFINLLRRNIPASKVLEMSLAEWKKSHLKGTEAQKLRIARAEGVLQRGTTAHENTRDPAAAYREIAAILKGT
jgi:hypothetical protein